MTPLPDAAARAALPEPLSDRYAWTAHAPVVLGLLALWLLATAWLRPLLLPDEARYAEVARTMLPAFGGDYLVPRLDGLPFFHKPPLTYWVDLLGMQLLGISPFTARLGPAFGAWLMGASAWFTLRRRFGPRVAGIGLTILATMPFVYVGGQYANHDMLVAGTITAAVLCLARSLEGGAPDLRWLLAGWAFCALAVLSKGLIGFVLPALVVGPWLLVQGRWRDMLRLLHPAGLLLFAGLMLPWFVVMQQRYPGFFDYFVMEQHFRRYATQGFNNQHPWWFYLGVLPVLTLPWGGWLFRLWPALRDGVPGWRRDGGWTLLMCWWTVAILGFFTLPASKLVGYIMPALAPGAMLLAPLLAQRQAWRLNAAAAALLCVAAVCAIAWKAPNSGRDVGQELRRLRADGDLVVMVEATFHDVAFEARLPVPPVVVSNWDDPQLPFFDNWRKELADAARFDPERGRATLVLPAQMAALPCHGHRVWWVVLPRQSSMVSAVPGAAQVFVGRNVELWRAEPRRCEAGA